ncbi:MAG: hypothetical protein ACOCY1_01330 [Halovenus sp.]
MTTTNARIRERFDDGRALNEHDSEDHTESVVVKRDDDPSDPDDGDVWYRTDNHEYRGREDGTTVIFDTTEA